MTGSAKQITWANEIKATAVTQINTLRTKAVAMIAAQPERADAFNAMLAIFDRIEACDNASLWIDARHLVNDAKGIRTLASYCETGMFN